MLFILLGAEDVLVADDDDTFNLLVMLYGLPILVDLPNDDVLMEGNDLFAGDSSLLLPVRLCVRLCLLKSQFLRNTLPQEAQ